MQSWLLKFGAIAALAQTISGAHIYVKTTNPPANRYVSHCTVIIDDDLFGCSGSSKPFSEGCGGNRGVSSQKICGDGEVEVNWHSGELVFTAPDGQHANCTLSTSRSGGECDTEDPNKYPPVHFKNAASGPVNVNNLLYGMGSVAAGLLL
ncbi:hypothetical protein P168DRAFT_291866 [Aspergillus campestris IBT 28561]|uniref:Uncharacterized protein n=1 Tax=Aspergillus campestris (strain IBT 28561) TaxID=1392248 RepID=A0A2I1CYN7_ASPC2|nr:uncharacterized protein P168DRAFT_291866 [Aspergillus campestris IBT 28561]PKY02733.1 hypothetical protein P168DRAFT_291866 [Aspergillus campestris IBT 28561]